MLVRQLAQKLSPPNVHLSTWRNLMRLSPLLLGLCVAVLLIINSSAEAACSGSGTTWSCTAGSTSSQINSALSSASNNAIITLAAGTYALGDDVNFLTSKGATIICASQGACTVTGGMIGMNGNCSGVLPNLYRVSGMVFSGGSTRSWWWGSGTSCTVQQLRIDHNTFSGQSAGQTIMYFGENSSPNNYFHGVVDHNTVTNAQSVYFAQVINGNGDNTLPDRLGSGNNLFFEDNTITITNMDNSGSGCVDGWGGHGVVWRFNTVTNCRVLMHGVTHTWGPINFEVYRNRITHTSLSDLPTGYRSIHHQGSGTYMVFDNQIAQASGQLKDSDAIVVLHYRAFSAGSGQPICDGTVSVDGNRSPTATYRGYPCKRQPGRDIDKTLKPIFAWGNRWIDTGSQIRLERNGDGFTPQHLLENRDYYNAVSASTQSSPTSPFNGTIGMGFGTLANRPTTCTTGREAADSGNGGVGYWATDVGEWNTSNGSAPDGQLYMCSATNTWSLYYKPYTYPHPLQVTGGTGGGALAPPPAPTNLQVQ